MGTTTDIESFYVGGKKAGALVRRTSSKLIETTLVFRTDDGPIVQLYQQTLFPADVLKWSDYLYVDHLEGSSVQVEAASETSLRDLLIRPIPSYAAHLVLKDFLATGEPRREFSQFDENAPDTVVPAAFVRCGDEVVQTPWGPRTALKVVLEVDGQAGNTFWCVDGVVVKSDWQGAESYASQDIDFVLQDLNSDVRTLLESALALS